MASILHAARRGPLPFIVFIIILGVPLSACEDPELRTAADSGAGSLAESDRAGSTETATPPSDAAEAVAGSEDPAGMHTARVETSLLGASDVKLVAVRTGRHEEYDRVVFQFAGTELPDYEVRSLARPSAPCTGRELRVPGPSWLQVEFSPTVAADGLRRAEQMDWSRLKGMALACSDGGEVTWILGTNLGSRHRVLEMSGPSRLVVDVMSRPAPATDR